MVTGMKNYKVIATWYEKLERNYPLKVALAFMIM